MTEQVFGVDPDVAYSYLLDAVREVLHRYGHVAALQLA
jgi:hypothetical protein